MTSREIINDCAACSLATYGTNSAPVVFTDRHSGGYQVIAFRGTYQMADWMTDGEVTLSSYKGGEMLHTGFMLRARSMLAAVAAAIDERPVYLTGHSMGGALAVIVADMLPKPPAAVVTFGQPRPGNFAFGDRFRDQHGATLYSFANDRDIVPRMAPRLLGYQHIVEPYYIDASGFIHKSKGIWIEVLDAVKAGVDKFVAIREGRLTSIEIFADHGMTNYLDLVAAWNWADGAPE